MNTKKIQFGNKIKTIREQLGVDRYEFIEALKTIGCKVAYSTLSDYEKDTARPSYEIFVAICKAGKVKPEWFLNIENDSPDTEKNNKNNGAISSIG